MSRITIKIATRTDGIGRIHKGYYVHDYGIPLGPCCKTYVEAREVARQYIASLNACLRGV